MTLDEYLEQTYSYLESIGLDVFIYSSTLLGIVRKGELLNRDGVTGDKEINIGCLAEDLTQDKIDRILQDNGFVKLEHSQYRLNTLVFFAPEWKDNTKYSWEKEDEWQLEPGFTLLVPFFRERNERMSVMGNSPYVLSWDSSHMDDKTKWGEIEYKDKKYKTPANPTKFLAAHFGKDWKKEKVNWHWTNDSGVLKQWEDIYKEKTLTKKNESIEKVSFLFNSKNLYRG